MRDYGSRYAAQRHAGAPAPMRPSAGSGFAYHRRISLYYKENETKAKMLELYLSNAQKD